VLDNNTDGGFIYSSDSSFDVAYQVE